MASARMTCNSDSASRDSGSTCCCPGADVATLVEAAVTHDQVDALLLLVDYSEAGTIARTAVRLRPVPPRNPMLTTDQIVDILMESAKRGAPGDAEVIGKCRMALTPVDAFGDIHQVEANRALERYATTLVRIGWPEDKDYREAELTELAPVFAKAEEIMRWEVASKKYHDEGTSVLGAGVAIEVLAPRARNAKRRVVVHAPYQGNVGSHKACQRAAAYLRMMDVVCYWYDGVMD